MTTFIMIVTIFKCSSLSKQNEFGVWEIYLPNKVDGSPPITHGSWVKVIFLVSVLFYFIFGFMDLDDLLVCSYNHWSWSFFFFWALSYNYAMLYFLFKPSVYIVNPLSQIMKIFESCGLVLFLHILSNVCSNILFSLRTMRRKKTKIRPCM